MFWRFGTLGCASCSFDILVDHAGMPFCVDIAGRRGQAGGRGAGGGQASCWLGRDGCHGGQSSAATSRSGAAAWRAADGLRCQLGERAKAQLADSVLQKLTEQARLHFWKDVLVISCCF